MPLPHYGGGQQPTPDKEFIYLGKDMDVKPYLWYYGANPLKFIKNNKYKLGFTEHHYFENKADYNNIIYYSKCSNIEIDGKNYNIKANFEELLNRELIPISVYRQQRIDEILEN